MDVTNKTILKYLSKMYSIANNTTEEDKLLDNIEENCYDMLEYINTIRRRKMKDERRNSNCNDRRQGRWILPSTHFCRKWGLIMLTTGEMIVYCGVSIAFITLAYLIGYMVGVKTVIEKEDENEKEN